jgi:hypothetical protein
MTLPVKIRLQPDDATRLSVSKNENWILSSNIYPHIASEMRVFVLALKISLARINMSFFSLFVGFYVGICFGHDKPPYCFGFSFMELRYSQMINGQPGTIKSLVIGKNYYHDFYRSGSKLSPIADLKRPV